MFHFFFFSLQQIFILDKILLTDIKKFNINLKFFIMKKLILFLTLLFSVSSVFASTKLDNGRLNVYSNGNASIGESTKTVKFKGEDIKIIVGIDSNYTVSEISFEGKISNKDFAEVKARILAANCFTSCSRTNKCSDKQTSAGVIGCYAECGIDCAQKALEELLQ